MTAKYIEPSVTTNIFSCAVCGALADQHWYILHARRVEDNGLPRFLTQDMVDELERDFSDAIQQEPEGDPKNLIQKWRRVAAGIPNLESRSRWIECEFDVNNLVVSKCYACDDISIWKRDTILFPPKQLDIEPNADLDADIQADFNEARTVVDISPRSAAALLRLCIQKLCVQLGYEGKNLNQDIGALVKKGLSPQIQAALDSVRVVGNNAVHPGTLFLKDGRETAVKLFELVNRIAYDTITHAKEIEALFDQKVPCGAKEQIKKRDGK